MAGAYLLVEQGAHAPERVELTASACVIGRHPDCDLVLEESAVSRRHARILSQGEQFFIQDLDSTNGTQVDGEEIRAGGFYRLNDGSRIRICSTRFVFRQATQETQSKRRRKVSLQLDVV